MNRDLEILYEWSKKWLVTFNQTKTVSMFFTSSRSSPQPNLFFNNVTLTSVSTHKHLGITFSENFSWHTHIQNIIKTAMKQIAILRKLKYLLSKDSLSKIYCTFILPLLEYASEIWDGCSDSDSYSLEKVQHEAALIVTGLSCFTSIDSLYF